MTVRQSVPRLVRLWGRMRPAYRFNDVSAVSDSWLAAEGIGAVLWDIDGTLMEYHAADVAPQFRQTIRVLFRSGGARHAILSNCNEERFVELGEIFPEVPVVRAYGIGDRLELRHLWLGKDSHSAPELKALFDQGGYQVRKPDARLVEGAMRILQVMEPQRVLVVGDQFLTDVASANLAGARAAKVRTFRRDTFPLPVRLSQRLEWLLYRLRYPAG